MFTLLYDQMGRSLSLKLPAHRIVSLVPSQTELLHYLGLEKETIGITRFCVHPAEWFRSKTRVGGTKDFIFQRINSLQPDLILANKEENTQAGIVQLAAHWPVWVSDVRTISAAMDMIIQIGTLTNRPLKAQCLVQKIEESFENLAQKQNKNGLKIAYLIWKDPYMAAGGDTFINDTLTHICKFENIFTNSPRYPTFSLVELQQLAPELVLLSSEPYPFRQPHIAEIAQALPAAKICLVDGEMFSWYGSRLLQTAKYLETFLGQIV